MFGHNTLERLAFATVMLLGACASYVPPAPVSPEAFSRDYRASYDRTWSAVT
jgi:hypothetical protein